MDTMNKEGNPVPSIEDLNVINLLEFFESFMDETCYDVGDSSTEDIRVTRIKNGLMLSCEWNDTKIILRNGVETNNGQPKECDHNYRTETGWSVCTKCGDIY